MFLLFSYYSQIYSYRYHFEVSNSIGSIEGYINLTVYEGDDSDDIDQKMNFESNLIREKDFGEYVASLHSFNNSTFIVQYHVSLICSVINIEIECFNDEKLNCH